MKKVEGKLKKIENLKLVSSGYDYIEELIKIIRKSQETLFLQYYIFRLDKTGKRVLNELHQAAQRGVKIKLLVDGFGSFSRELISYKRANLEISFFSSLYSTLTSNNRLSWLTRRIHYKVVVADAKAAMIDGINIGDEYCSDKPWLDMALSYEGALCRKVEKVCKRNWFQRHMTMTRSKNFKVYEWDEKHSGAMVRVSDYKRGFKEIYESYQWALGKAQKEVFIISGYFFPGKKMRKLLLSLSEKGVKVKVLISKRHDVPFYKAASNYSLRKFGEAGIEIYEWGKSIVHGKMMIVDGKWLTLGSFNMDRISIFGNLEINTEVYNHPEITNIKEQTMSFLNDSSVHQLSIKQLEKKYLPVKVQEYICYIWVRFIMNILSGFVSEK